METKQLFIDWVAEFDKVVENCEPTSEYIMRIILGLAAMEHDKIEISPEMQNDFGYKVASKRSEFVGLPLNPYAVILLCSLCDTPGEMVMYIYYIRAKSKNGIGTVTLTVRDIVRMFIKGFPSKTDLNTLWDKQKVKGLNLLDMEVF